MYVNKDVREPKFLLLYSPQRFDPRFGAVKPEGSLGIAYLAGALRASGYEVAILDCSVGAERHRLEATFFRQITLPNGMIRVGMSLEAILREVQPWDVIGISSIFTAQTSMVTEVVAAVSREFPDKLIVLGGINARSQMDLFFRAGADIVCLSEAETTILQIGEVLRQNHRDFSGVSGIAWKIDSQIRINPTTFVEKDLDKLAIPAWDMQPLRKYWDIARPHGGGFSSNSPVAYAPMMTSRGCPFSCSFCHIGKEVSNSASGNIGELRIKSMARVMKELTVLKSLGVEHVFIEDDSLLGRKRRAIEIFRRIICLNVKLSGVNGINIAHLNTKIGERLVVDDEILETMAAAGFSKIMLPVESGSQRIIDKYATGKLNLAKHNIPAIIRKLKSLGIAVGGNYTFGYPDETLQEVRQTVACAREHLDAGLDNANFMIITPFPGTEFYDRVVNEGLLLPGVALEDMDWMRVCIKTQVPEKVLMAVLIKGWEKLNRAERVTRIRSLVPKTI